MFLLFYSTLLHIYVHFQHNSSILGLDVTAMTHHTVHRPVDIFMKCWDLTNSESLEIWNPFIRFAWGDPMHSLYLFHQDYRLGQRTLPDLTTSVSLDHSVLTSFFCYMALPSVTKMHETGISCWSILEKLLPGAIHSWVQWNHPIPSQWLIITVCRLLTALNCFHSLPIISEMSPILRQINCCRKPLWVKLSALDATDGSITNKLECRVNVVLLIFRFITLYVESFTICIYLWKCTGWLCITFICVVWMLTMCK
jgi:hypothetical protein